MMLALPAAVALVDSKRRVASPLVIVTGRLPAGAGVPRDPPILTCRFFPTAAPPREILIVLFVTWTLTVP